MGEIEEEKLRCFLTQRKSDVYFVSVAMPEANDLTVGIMALVVQAEGEAISRRMKEALAVAMARGVKLGNPYGAASLRWAGKGVTLRAEEATNSDAFARRVGTRCVINLRRLLGYRIICKTPKIGARFTGEIGAPLKIVSGQ
ncbi:recombinase family protein [Pseudotabrizicola sediminis]|uniref:recombinase family protein n=1 Tax=Pseudotabrizicola sediminis TaxID=2486418 RepID=UPI001AEBDB7E|nr:recombinase family protein [Pseudotabrizicola sediminis]